MDKVKFGIAGCGGIGSIHAEAIKNVSIAELEAVYDPVLELAERLGRKYEVKYYTDYEEMLSNPHIDAVNICTPSGLHADLGIKASQYGKHVLVEKPIDIKLEKADALIESCKRYNVKLGVVSQHRFDPGVRVLKKVIAEGKLGKLIIVDAYIKWFRPQSYYDSSKWRGTWALDGGGTLINQAIHCVDLLLYLAGSVEKVDAYCATLAHNIEVEDTAIVLVKYTSGAMGIIQSSTACYPGFTERLEFYGTNGSVILESSNIKEIHLKGEIEALENIIQVGETSGASEPLSIGINGHIRQIQDMAEAILFNRAPSITGEDGENALKFVLSVYKLSGIYRES